MGEGLTISDDTCIPFSHFFFHGLTEDMNCQGKCLGTLGENQTAKPYKTFLAFLTFFQLILLHI
jgi:hypothetical protein